MSVYEMWTQKNAASFSENILFSYFVMLAEKYSSSSLWSDYSMLKRTLVIHYDVHIEDYKKLKAFLKRKSAAYTPKKANK